MTAAAMLSRSNEADALHFYALRYVDQVSHRHYGGRMPHDVAGDVYQKCVGAEAHRRMLEELDPINRQLVKLVSMSLEPLAVPPEIEAFRQMIVGRWTNAVAELLGNPDLSLECPQEKRRRS